MLIRSSDAYFEKQGVGKNNFISELFFLTVAAHHYGTEATRNQVKDMDRELKHMNKQIEQFETERHKYVKQSCTPCSIRQSSQEVQRSIRQWAGVQVCHSRSSAR